MQTISSVDVSGMADVDSGQIMIADVEILAKYSDCDKKELEYNGVVVRHNLEPGNYSVDAERVMNYWGDRVASVGVSKYRTDSDHDYVTIVSDELIFVDPCYVLRGEFDDHGEGEYGSACEVSLSSQGYGNIGDTGMFVTTSGLGDGSYPVEGLNIHFLYEEEEDEYEDEYDDEDEDEDEDW